MNTSKTTRLLVLLALAALFATACGDDDKSNDGKADAGAIDTGIDGAVAVGDASSLGDAANSPACPAQAPQSETACTQNLLQCRYATSDCSCERASPVDPTRWQCEGRSPGTPQSACPASEPAAGSTCMNIRGTCMFGTRVCDCLDGNNTWACWSPADCPRTIPAEQSACTTVGMSCEYNRSGQVAANGNDECDCEASGWDCGRQFCPAAQPTVGGACEGGEGTCSFGDNACDCVGRMWACWKPSDCPAAAPAEGSACTVNGMLCPYGQGECACEGTRWDCSGIPRPRSDAGVRDAGAASVVDAATIDAAGS